MKSLEDMLIPAAIAKDLSIADQFKKLATEVQEVGVELKSYYDFAVEATKGEGEPDKKLLFRAHSALQSAAIEAGDVIIAAVTLIDKLGYRLPSVIQTCYRKNEVRGYYDINGGNK